MYYQSRGALTLLLHTNKPASGITFMKRCFEKLDDVHAPQERCTC